MKNMSMRKDTTCAKIERKDKNTEKKKRFGLTPIFL